MSKLTFHFQVTTPWLQPLFNEVAGYEWAKIIDPPREDIFPGKRTIGRVWIGGDNIEMEYIKRREQGAEEYFRLCLPYYRRAPWVHCWEGPNEPFVGKDDTGIDYIGCLVAFTRRWVQLMHGVGYKTAAYCLSVGWPDTEEDCRRLAEGCEDSDYLALHEYGGPNMWDQAGWRCLRYRRTVAAMRATGRRVPPVLITELGVDGGVISWEDRGRGWKSFLGGDAGRYMEQLAWYDAEIGKDDYVLCATIFTAGSMGWDDFDVSEELARALADHVRAGAMQPPAIPPPAEPEPPQPPAGLSEYDLALWHIWQHRPDIQQHYLSNGWTDWLPAMRDWLDMTTEAAVAADPVAYARAQGWMPAEEAPMYGPDPNVPYYHSDRHGYRPQWIILHDTEGSAAAALAWWQSPDNPRKSSAHWLVKSDGEIIPVVPEHLAAHHAGGGAWPGIPEGSTGGTSNINHVSIGIELEYPKAPASPPWPEAQLKAAVKLVADVARRYGIPRERIRRHCDVDPQNRRDPRNLDWAMFLARVMEEQQKMAEERIRDTAWKALGIPYNPNAAFPRYAREHSLGNPVTREVDVAGYRLQGYAGGIVYARIGDWANVKHMPW